MPKEILTRELHGTRPLWKNRRWAKTTKNVIRYRYCMTGRVYWGGDVERWRSLTFLREGRVYLKKIGDEQKNGHQVFLMEVCEKAIMSRYFLMQVAAKNDEPKKGSSDIFLRKLCKELQNQRPLTSFFRLFWRASPHFFVTNTPLMAGHSTGLAAGARAVSLSTEGSMISAHNNSCNGWVVEWDIGVTSWVNYYHR